MGSNCFSALEIDAVGEILNISLGASATAVSTMLNTRVDITTPVVNVVRKDEFKMDRVEPAIGVEITYISGLEGSNVMLLKRHDVRVIVEMLMGIPMTDEEFELNEMNISAVCEVMNQMMGASSTALSEFLGKVVNISTPISFEVENEKAFIDKYFSDDDYRVVVKFALKIADQLESEFFNVMPISLAKSLVKGFLPDDVIVDPANVNEETKDVPNEEAAPSSGGKQTLSQEEIESLLNAEGSTQAMFEQPAESQQDQMSAGMNQQMNAQMNQDPQMNLNPQTMAQQPMMSGMADASMMQMQMQMMQQMMQQMQQMQQQQEEKQKAAEPKLINVQPMVRQDLNQDRGVVLQEEQEENMELIMGVPLEISVEIGRTKKLVKDILDFTKGSLVVLDKLAGEQVDLFVNGQCIAKGDVVVVEDNFGIRITEITKINLATLE
ncbi:flagellar motor switch protein FliN [Lachnospiraceae bacterium AM23-2LB]|uniref:flagellar motor switch protein FliN n=1 Tax=Mediterraneibacter glycyrrhizinilyticus TaxID=342942 RepID=UPI0006CFDAAF|nr:flagellar motor switch protein FliN [Mediterraneibacter glycyrrhizinilyticus]RGC73248.1 flagellar motor switch protein FliN [Lachnospiraceae bacterium AM23-2LB]RJW02906.1 flagellar motor switch protein FliN [Lachnospiraceae bacterium AM40-2BH]